MLNTEDTELAESTEFFNPIIFFLSVLCTSVVRFTLYVLKDAQRFLTGCYTFIL